MVTLGLEPILSMMKVFSLLLLNILCINIHSLVDYNSISQGQQKKYETPVVNPQSSTPSLCQNDQGIIIELATFLVLTYIKYFDG